METGGASHLGVRMRVPHKVEAENLQRTAGEGAEKEAGSGSGRLCVRRTSGRLCVRRTSDIMPP